MHNLSVATEERLRLTLRDLASPVLRRKRTFAVTFLFVVCITLLPVQLRFQKYQSDSQAASNTLINTQGSQSLAEADLDRDAKIAEHNYLLSLSTLERARDPLPGATALIVVIAIVLGMLISLSVASIVDYCDPCFHTPVQVIRTLGIPLVVAIPKRSS